jgi:hypothetical protein
MMRKPLGRDAPEGCVVEALSRGTDNLEAAGKLASSLQRREGGQEEASCQVTCRTEQH